MEAIFTLLYSEYAVINELNRLLKKKGYSVYIPTSRLEKGVDLAITKSGTNCMARVQVKYSRSYKVDDHYDYHLWLRNFDGRDKEKGGAKEGDADFYIILGIYPKYKQENKSTSKDVWKHALLCFNDKEMFEFLDEVKTKKEGKKDTQIRLWFNLTEKGCDMFTKYPKYKNISEFLLENKVDEITSFLEKKAKMLKQNE